MSEGKDIAEKVAEKDAAMKAARRRPSVVAETPLPVLPGLCGAVGFSEAAGDIGPFACRTEILIRNGMAGGYGRRLVRCNAERPQRGCRNRGKRPLDTVLEYAPVVGYEA